jgi:hypothetical protein
MAQALHQAWAVLVVQVRVQMFVFHLDVMRVRRMLDLMG